MKNNTILPLLFSFLFCCAAIQLDARADSTGEYYENVIKAPENPGYGVLAIDVEQRLWIPSDVKFIRGVVVHQHGCGEGSCDGARTGVYDLQWQELARKHDCALFVASYRQGDFSCETWCDPRNGSAQSFLKGLEYFASASNHPEIASAPWALWGHSGGGHWVGSMCQLYPNRIVGAWLRSGCPNTVGQIFDELPMNSDVLNVPMTLNLGAKESDFSIVWGSCWPYFSKMRAKGAKIGFLMDPNTAHETGNSRYPAIRFLDDCLTARLPKEGESNELRPSPQGFVLPIDEISDAELSAENIVLDPEKPTGDYTAEERRNFLKDGVWLINEDYLSVWRKYARSGDYEDSTPPPAPTNVAITPEGLMTWNCRADLESGLKSFIVYCDDEKIVETPTAPTVNARPTFQGIMYSDTPDYSLVKMERQIENYDSSKTYAISSVNTCELTSARVKASTSR